MPLTTWPASVLTPRFTNFRDVLWKVATHDGQNPERDGLQYGDAAQITSAINSAYKYAYEFYDWPEAVQYIELGVQLHPTTGTPFIPRVYLTSYGRQFELWTTHPLSDPSASPVPFSYGPDGLYLEYEGPTVVLYCRPDPPKFTSIEWDETVTYALDALVYSPELGSCYRSVGAVAGEAPGVSANWVGVPFLKVLEEATAAGAFALYKRGQGQIATGKLLEGAMIDLLEHEIIQINNQEGQSKAYLSGRMPAVGRAVAVGGVASGSGSGGGVTAQTLEVVTSESGQLCLHVIDAAGREIFIPGYDAIPD